MFSKKCFFLIDRSLKIFFDFSRYFDQIFAYQNLVRKFENLDFSKNRKYIFLDRSIFFWKKLFFENFFYFLKVNRLNFNRLVVRNSRARYHHFDTTKTGKCLPKLPLPRLWERASNHGQNPQMDVRLPSNDRNSELRRSWLCNQSIGSLETSCRTTFPHVWGTLGPPESRYLEHSIFF